MADGRGREQTENIKTLQSLSGNNLLHVTLTAASPTYQMKVGDTHVIVDTTSAGGDAVAIITLPPVGDCTGMSYYIEAPVGAAGGDLSVYEQEGTAAEISTYGDMDADGDKAIFFSTGREWVVTFDGVA